ncbi:hypothetical protein O988_00200 [Pseudogymnoascus sp. VKM F-3808]|nr:hypothetical protein O988_00200 [Pseudogymnoascus sp. VKM F-3808]
MADKNAFGSFPPPTLGFSLASALEAQKSPLFASAHSEIKTPQPTGNLAAMADKKVAESPFSQLQAFVFDTEVISMAFSPDSTRFAVLSNGQVVVFAINENKSVFSFESKTPEEFNATSFCWDLSKPSIFVVVTTDTTPRQDFLALYNVITREVEGTYGENLGEITAVTCAIMHEKKFLILGDSSKITYIDLDIPANPRMYVDLTSQVNFGEFPGAVTKLEVKNGNLAILAAKKDDTFSAFGLIPKNGRPDIAIRAWGRQYKTGLKYGSIALCYDGTSFITNCVDDIVNHEMVPAKIYAGNCTNLVTSLNHRVDDFKLQGEVHAISCYPSTLESKHDVFSVAGDGGEIRFFAKNSDWNTFHYLEAYTTPSIWKSGRAYNASTMDLCNCVGDGTIIQTMFSPDGRYFAYTTTQGFIGVLNFKLLKDESFMMTKSEREKKERRENEAWFDWCEKLRIVATKKTKGMPGAFPEE